MTTQRIGKYACLEIERRYLLGRVPDGVLETPGGWRIVDRYFADTRLRLRRMQALEGEDVLYKLTQKYRSETQSAAESTITNLYLNEAEYRLFAALPALIVEKRRYPYRLGVHRLSIDVFEGRHAGLVLAEMELEAEDGTQGLRLPDFILREVTGDPFFTGGRLAGMGEAAFREGLAERLAG